MLTVVTLPVEEERDPALADYLSEWEEKGGDELAVRPLERADVKEYVTAVLGEAALDEAGVEFLFTFTGGNPLLLGESIRQLLGADDPAARLAGDGVTEVPARIRRLLERRLQRLDAPTRSFIDVVAVVGETSHELPPILRLLDVDEASGLATLDRACTLGLIHEDDDGRISFTSELLHTVTYDQLRANQRRSLHGRAGEWFDEQRQFSEAAHHYERAEDWRRMVPAAFQAADAAEHVGLYPAALSLYRRLKTRAEPAELFPRMAKALMIVGDWGEAERVLIALPSNDPQTMLLRARLCLARGDITGAAQHATRALGNRTAEDIDALLCLASIYLSAGDFPRATDHAGRALLLARETGSINEQARCHVVVGGCQSHNGDPEAAEASFRDGLWLLDSCPPESRDIGVYSALLGNRGYIEEITHRWSDAECSHREALRLRQNVADAVGVLESTLALGRVCLGHGDLGRAEAHLTDALRLAVDLGEELQQAKVVHAQGELAARTGDIEAGRGLLTDARSRFVKCGTPYDIAYADLSLARILAGVHPRESVRRLAMGRAAVETRGFELLKRLFPELGPRPSERIHAGLLAYAAGDAFGLPWEGHPPGEVRIQELDQLPDHGVWPSGSTSDDTALTLLVAEHLAAAGGIGDPLRFLDVLAGRSGSIKGLGPSTTRAIEHFMTTGTPDDSGSNTNGGAMRALPVGWALPPKADDQRRAWTLALTRMTHTGPDALAAACVISACASWAIEGAPVALLAEVAADEAGRVGPNTGVARALTALREGTWTPPVEGISLDPAATVTAVLHCCLTTDGDLVSALRRAVGLGGDTDTVAALVGGLLGCRHAPAEIAARLAWLNRVALPPAEQLSRLAKALADIRLTVDE